jgi:hypothetical protein
VFLNGFFLAKGNELGYLGGAVEAFTFALLNVGVSFLIAAAGVRELNHRNLLRKLFGLISLLGYLALTIASISLLPTIEKFPDRWFPMPGAKCSRGCR